MSETFRINLALFSAAIVATWMVLGSNVSMADMARLLEAIR